MKAGRIIRAALVAAVLAFASWFFVREFQRHWAHIAGLNLAVRPGFLVLSFLLMLTAYLLATWAWQYSIGVLSGRRIGFRDSIVVVNSSGLAKYIPGKLWVYGLQIMWMASRGYSRALVLYAGLLNIIGTLLGSLAAGCGILSLVLGGPARGIALAGFVLTLLACLAVIFAGGPVLNAFTRLVNRIFKRNIEPMVFRAHAMTGFVAVYILSALFFGAGSWAAAVGAGFDPTRVQGLLISGSFLVSDVAGFLAVITPGGLGVREGAMLFLLRQAGDPALGVIVPLVSRVLTMFVDISLGALSLILLRRFLGPKASPTGRN